MTKEDKKVLDIYRLIIPKTNIVIPIPCITELKEETQLANIDLFSVHFTNAQELVNYTNSKGWTNYYKPVKNLLVQYGSGKKMSTRTVLYKDDEVVSGFANRNETTALKDNLNSFAQIFLENMRVGTFSNFLDNEGFYHYNGRNSQSAKKRTTLNKLISEYYDQMKIIKINDSPNEKTEAVIRADKIGNEVAEELSKSYRLVRDLCMGIKNYNLAHSFQVRKPLFKVNIEELDELITPVKTSEEIYRESQLKMYDDPDRNPYFATNPLNDPFDNPEVPIDGLYEEKNKQKSLGGLKGIPKMYEE